MAYTRRKSTPKSSKYSKPRRKTSTGPRRSVKKSKTAVKFTKRQMSTYVSLVRAKREPTDSEE